MKTKIRKVLTLLLVACILSTTSVTMKILVNNVIYTISRQVVAIW